MSFTKKGASLSEAKKLLITAAIGLLHFGGGHKYTALAQKSNEQNT